MNQPIDPNLLHSHRRTGDSKPTNSHELRSAYQRDFDRVIFSSAFRKLQDKTQVFPLPGSVFVHNRLTHSLEVASVGRSLANLVGNQLCSQFKNDLTPESQEFYRYDFYNVISAACLCHDIGNPAFGHSGEDAIASFFRKNGELKVHFSREEWEDLVHFEGNANAIRVLTQKQKGQLDGGLRLTYSTLCAIAKYPCESTGRDKKVLSRKKFGFFQTEKSIFQEVARHTAMICDSETPLCYLRHPFVWLVEAADDICYNIMDLEDAHRLGIIEHGVCVELLRSLLFNIGIDNHEILNNKIDNISDKNDQIEYLRAKAIAALTTRTQELYMANISRFLDGSCQQSIFDSIKEKCTALQEIVDFSVENVYNHRHVVEIENAGYNIMYELLAHFVPSIITPKEQREVFDKKAIRLLPNNFNYDGEPNNRRIMGVVDWVAGMTDNYAMELYRRIKGIEIGMKM